MRASGSRPGARVLVANFDFEEELGARDRGQRSRRPLSTAARQVLQGFEPLLRALLRSDDVVVAAAEAVVDPSAWSAILAWAESPSVAALRATGSPAPRAPERRALSASLAERLWSLRPPSPEACRRIADRRWQLAVAQSLGQALPGAFSASSVDDIGRGLAGGTGRTAEWIAKAPFSAAGRHRMRFTGMEVAVKLQSLLERHGALVVEPWMRRSEDLGASLLFDGSGFECISLHRQEVAEGRTRAIVVGPDDAALLSGSERARLDAMLAGLAPRFERLGFRGLVGLDLWRYWAEDGERLHLLGELNPRWTFGTVARCLREQALRRGRMQAGEWLRLVLSPAVGVQVGAGGEEWRRVALAAIDRG